MLTDITLTELPSVTVALPPNITRIEAQADLYGYGVRTLGFLEVADEAEAVERAEGRDAFLLKSKIRPVYFLIFPHVIVK
jgi:hypothetical protein